MIVDRQAAETHAHAGGDTTAASRCVTVLEKLRGMSENAVVNVSNFSIASISQQLERVPIPSRFAVQSLV